jgi:long-chain acyl-CoA synthetase
MTNLASSLVNDRVGVMLPNVPQFAIVYLTDPEAKAVFAWHEFAAAAEHGAAEAGADCIVVAPGEFETRLQAASPVEGVADRQDDDTAVILYTSPTDVQAGAPS